MKRINSIIDNGLYKNLITLEAPSDFDDKVSEKICNELKEIYQEPDLSVSRKYGTIVVDGFSDDFLSKIGMTNGKSFRVKEKDSIIYIIKAKEAPVIVVNDNNRVSVLLLKDDETAVIKITAMEKELMTSKMKALYAERKPTEQRDNLNIDKTSTKSIRPPRQWQDRYFG